MAALVITNANNKGGVGKTTITVNLADALAREGFSVCVIDLDPQSNCSQHLSKTLIDPDRSIVNVLQAADDDLPLDFDSFLTETIIDNVKLLPSTLKLDGLESDIHNAYVNPLLVLKRRIEPLLDQFDIILIDTAPSLGLWLRMALTVSSKVIIPADTSGQYTMQGTKDLQKFIKQVQRDVNPELETLGAVATKVTATNASQAVMGLLSIQFNMFETVIHSATVITESQLAKMTVLQHARTSRCAKEFVNLAREVLSRCGLQPKRKNKPGPKSKTTVSTLATQELEAAS
ncbi:ParA family protein [Paraburkholderia sp. UCT31]|uniref:ParA family protein n=1 Tax=Paraburkholderia sp. UCT31 TaxID=2615209 RepID=UPI001655C40F|nr:ParA family protein [Paraburkholderia sp. UCT31]MBC8737254.1 ParA family protein [Paraburkholderia sp. UCT31]